MGKQKTHEEFIEELSKRNKHFNKLFSVIGTYKNANEKIEVDTKYGICEVSSNSLLRGTAPTISTARDRNDFCVRMFNEVHNNLYDYSEIDYVKSKEKVNIICKRHGNFYQTPKEHLKGSGCHVCANLLNSFCFNQWVLMNSDKEAVLYVLECSNLEETFIKVGITSISVKERYKGKVRMPYSYSIIHEFKTHNRKLIWDTEKEIKLCIDKYNPKLSFKGSKQECFEIENKERILNIIKLRIDEATRRD